MAGAADNVSQFTVEGISLRSDLYSRRVCNSRIDSQGVMTISFRKLRVADRTRSLFAILVLGAVLPSAAHAACSGPHVIKSSQSPNRSAHLELLDFAGALPDRQKELPSRPVPCSGAMCSGNPASPLSTIPSITPDAHENWAVSSPSLSPISPRSFVYAAVHANTGPVDRASFIFHPPRK
jgi:hypothetical protein